MPQANRCSASMRALARTEPTVRRSSPRRSPPHAPMGQTKKKAAPGPKRVRRVPKRKCVRLDRCVRPAPTRPRYCCANCGVTESSGWRRIDVRRDLAPARGCGRRRRKRRSHRLTRAARQKQSADRYCNRCGLHYKAHGVHRPVEGAAGGEQQRVRRLASAAKLNLPPKKAEDAPMFAVEQPARLAPEAPPHESPRVPGKSAGTTSVLGGQTVTVRRALERARLAPLTPPQGSLRALPSGPDIVRLREKPEWLKPNLVSMADEPGSWFRRKPDHDIQP